MRTNHVSFTRGSSFSFTRVVRDDDQRPVDLTGAIGYMAIRADRKIAPTLKLTSDDPAPAGWVTRIVIADQATYPGKYTVTLEPGDTTSMEALGSDDPWIYDVKFVLGDSTVFQDVDESNLDLYPQVTDLPT